MTKLILSDNINRLAEIKKDSSITEDFMFYVVQFRFMSHQFFELFKI